MTNQINKSRLFKMAWKAFKNNKKVKNFGTSLKWAWKVLKEEAARKAIEAKGFDLNLFSIIRETEKAICVKATIACEATDQYKERLVWFPKSQIIDGFVKSWIVRVKVQELLEEYTSYPARLSVEW